MSKFLVAALLLCLVNHGVDLATAWDDKDFFKYCPPSKCSQHGPEIRFPYRLESSNTSSACGSPCMKLACSGQDTILVDPVLDPCKVTAIDYSYPAIKIIPPVDSLSPCPLQKLLSRSIPADVAYAENRGPCDRLYDQYYASLVCCSREFTPSFEAAGPIPCLSNITHFSYLFEASEFMSVLPLDCKVCSDGIVPVPMAMEPLSEFIMSVLPFKVSAERILSFSEIPLWTDPSYETGASPNESIYCPQCERQGQNCAFSSQRNQTFCMRHGIVSNWPKAPYSCTDPIYFVTKF